jgi:hypothetical protein
MSRHAALATAIILAALAVVPTHVQASRLDTGFAAALCATIAGHIIQLDTVQTGLLISVRDRRLERTRSALLTNQVTIEDRHGNRLQSTAVRVGDYLTLYVPGDYRGAPCALAHAPRVRFAQDLSR